MMLARRYNQGAIRIRDIAYEEDASGEVSGTDPARTEERPHGGECARRQRRLSLRRPPSEIHLAEIIRLIDGALAPFGDADQLRT